MNIFRSKATAEAMSIEPVNKFKQGDIGFTLKDKEKVLILKCVVDSDDRNSDLGPTYLVRGDRNICFRLYECEINTLDEAVT